MLPSLSSRQQEHRSFLGPTHQAPRHYWSPILHIKLHRLLGSCDTVSANWSWFAYLLILCDRDLDKQEAEIKEKLKQEKKREERKNREAFSELLREDMDEGFIKPKMRWKVLTKPAHCCQLF